MTSPGTREAMKSYWKAFAPSLESMMLDSNANIIGADENAEILSKLPSTALNKKKKLLELGAGIGRFTGQLADMCNSVTAVDFIESYIEQNRKANFHRDNLTCICADATKVEFEAHSFDIIFTNWLLMYLDDKECERLLENCLMWLKPGGYLFIRESCLRPSGDSKRPATNPTKYRAPSDYHRLLGNAKVKNIDDNTYGYSVESVSNVRAYVLHKNNPNQICFLASKQEMAHKRYRTFQEFLDQSQYTREGVKRYEWIFGETFLSSGGLETTEKIVRDMNIKSGSRILDVGCGIGGHDFYMAENYNVQITAIDLSANMMAVALEHFAKRPHLTNKIKFEIMDITTAKFADNSFDLIYSRDTLLHIADKPALFRKLFSWLAPGGKIVFTDYGHSEKEHSEEFKSYVAQRGYTLFTVPQYKDLLESVGFKNVKSEDFTEWWQEILQKELDRLVNNKADFFLKFSEQDFGYLKQGWEAKIKRASEGDQVWICCSGTK